MSGAGDTLAGIGQPALARIARAARTHRLMRLLVGLPVTLAALVLTPVYAWHSFDHYYGWSSVPLLRAIRGGYVREDFTGYLFQQPYGDHFVRGAGDWFGNPFAFVVVSWIGLIIAVTVLHWLARAVAAVQLPGGFAPATVGPIDEWAAVRSRSVVVRMLARPRSFRAVGTLPAHAGNGGHAGHAGSSHRVVRMAIERGLLVVRVPLAGAVPPVLLEAAGGRSHRLRRLRMRAAGQVVLEGAFLERFRAWMPPHLHAAAPRLLSPYVLQLLTQVPEASYLEAASGELVAAVPVRLVGGADDVADLLERLRAAGDALASETADAPELAEVVKRSGPVSAWRQRTLRLGALVAHGWWVTVAIVAVVALDFGETVFRDRGLNENTLLLHLTLLGWLLVLAALTPFPRRTAGGPVPAGALEEAEA